MNGRLADAVVVGAGFAGLSAAHRLIEHGLDIVVLEARERVGGRVDSVLLESGIRLDSGGQFLCEDMAELYSLAGRRGKRLVGTRMTGRTLMQPAVSDGEANRIWHGSATLRARMNALDLGDPRLAGLTVADWLAGQPDDADVKAAFRSTIEGLWCIAADAVPLWYLVDNDRRVTNETSELQFFLADTMHGLAEDLAAGLGDRLRLGARVTALTHRPGAVEMTTEGGTETIAGRYTILALPPVQAARVAFRPALSAPLAGALAAWKSGTVIKVLVGYRHAFWRERGLSGMVTWRDPTGLFVADTTKDDAHPTLVVFVGGPLALSWRALGPEGLRDSVMAHLIAALGAQAADVTAFAAAPWFSDDGGSGGYSDLVMEMAAHDAEALLRQGSPPLLFASSELSPSYPGYVEGAIIAGRAAADRVVAEMGRPGG